MTTLLLLAGFLLQDAKDLAKWVEKLSDESIQVREEASAHLESLGPAAVADLTQLKEGLTDLEQKSRLESVIGRIEKRAELLKVFGPTKRATFSGKGVPLEKVLKDVGDALGETLKVDKIDLRKPIDLELKNVTLWEALDRIAEAVEGHYDYGDSVMFKPGKRKPLPALYYEQFRVGVGEIKRIDHREPGLAETTGLVVIIAQYQRGLRPTRGGFDKAITISSIQTAKGDAKAGAPGWLGSTNLGMVSMCEKHDEYFTADPGDILKVEGTVQMAFATGMKEITLDLTGEGKSCKVGDVTLSVTAFSQSAAGAHLSITAKGPSEIELGNSMGMVQLIDADGTSLWGQDRSGSGMQGEHSWDFVFAKELPKAKKVTFKWATEFHKVEIPFRLEGVKVP